MPRKLLERRRGVHVARDLPSERIEAPARKIAPARWLLLALKLVGIHPSWKIEGGRMTPRGGIAWKNPWSERRCPREGRGFRRRAVEAEVEDSELARAPRRKRRTGGLDIRLRERLRWVRKVDFPSDGKTVPIRRRPGRERRSSER
ncbi:hypothetical protein NL676_019521 [Syzygium grande]|nr:hypothetical protein NL676_019521 [Syzygium grande]